MSVNIVAVTIVTHTGLVGCFAAHPLVGPTFVMWGMGHATNAMKRILRDELGGREPIDDDTMNTYIKYLIKKYKTDETVADVTASIVSCQLET
jgi:hypothetical protein